MLDAVCAFDPLFAREVRDPIPLEETPEYRFFAERPDPRPHGTAATFCREFDARLNGRTSVLLGTSPQSEAIAADAVRAVFGIPREGLSDDEALDWLLHPAKNSYLAETLNVHTLSKLSRAMEHVHYTFAKKLSHTADSQDQRHRMTPASRPILKAHYTGIPDTITPALLRANPEAEALYERVNAIAFEAINRLLDMGVSEEFAFYLLPNGTAIRFVESGSLMDWHHKWRTRLCYNAQEEIFHASLEEVLAVREVHPRIGRYLHAPCWFREVASESPYCPEGERFCGVAVWKLEPEAFRRTL